ncbi:transglutaminase-like domain-containing protein [Agarivorans aestuarii]|uniref:Transglutaminase-like domain-containing protein n=1 Tax=Agarivorans aestuarii TaxID=1563703 RepID=A0ABU7G618_9ALTE|nr:transglutaminase-like domain-containing protein [Agarivorans aestuarii]MEE1674730.1 transglutaminase-like domain-containing protein [Agarivorans aestuarii]
MTNSINYASFSEFSDPQHYLAQLPTGQSSVAELVKCVQHNLVHPYWLQHYQLDPDFTQRLDEMQTRSVQQKLKCLDNAEQPLLADKPASQRMLGNCRDFALLLCTLLRAQNIPARLRCGFATYLGMLPYEDHWICEYWHKQRQRWIKVDAQLDAKQQTLLNITLDPLDLPDGEFVYAGTAWQLSRNTPELAEQFGILSITGWPLLQGNLLRDIFALSKVELLAWDSGWGLNQHYFEYSQSKQDLQLLDQLAELSAKSLAEQALAQTKSQELAFPTNWQWQLAPSIEELLQQHNSTLEPD